jgi:hypothetical protein
MMTETKTQVTFSRETWEELRKDDYFRELIEVIKDREAFIKAKEETVEVLDFKEYDKNRRTKINV